MNDRDPSEIVSNIPTSTKAAATAVNTSVSTGRCAASYKSRSRDRFVFLLLTAIVALLYAPSLGFTFVNWDDPWYVTNNPLIKSWTPGNLWGIVTATVTRNFAPVNIFSYLVDHTLWGDWAGGYHFSNLLWHAVNACLVFVLVRQVTGRGTWAIGTALLFAIHPVQVETVAWISSRKGLISATFILLSLRYWLKAERTSRDELLGTLMFLLAMFAKALGIIVPGIVLIYDWLVRGRSFAESLSRQLVGILLAIWFTLLTAGAQNSVGGGIRHHFGMSKLEILGLDSLLLWRYLAMLVRPVDLAVLYDPPLSGQVPLMLLASAGWLLLGFWLWRVRHERPLLVFAVACAFAPLVPVLNLFPLTTLMNDRYLYLPCIPLFVLAIAGGEQLIQAAIQRFHITAPRFALRLQGVIWIVVLTGYSLMTMNLLPVWRNDLALWQHTARVTPDLPVVQYQLGLALWNAGESAAALQRIDRALANPRTDSFDRERFSRKREELAGKLTGHPVHTGSSNAVSWRE